MREEKLAAMQPVTSPKKLKNSDGADGLSANGNFNGGAKRRRGSTKVMGIVSGNKPRSHLSHRNSVRW